MVGNFSCLRFVRKSRWVLSAIFTVSVGKKLVEAAQLGPRDLVLTQGEHIKLRRGIPSGTLAHLGGDTFGVDFVFGQANLDDRLHTLHRMRAQELQNTHEMPWPGGFAVAFFQGFAQLRETRGESPIA